LEADAPVNFVYPDICWCPLCGATANHDSWWTPAQLEYQQEVISVFAQLELSDAIKDLNQGGSNDFIQISVSVDGESEMPDPLVEVDDMEAITPPCHPWEPVKVPSDAAVPFYCLVCGSPFAV